MPPVARAFSRRDTVLFVSCIVLALAAIQLPDRIRDPFAAAMRQTILAPLVAVQSDAEQSRRSWLTREQREAQRDSIALRSMSLDAALSENDRLRKLLGLGAALKWGFVPAEVLQGRGVGEEYTITLSAGRARGYPAVQPRRRARRPRRNGEERRPDDEHRHRVGASGFSRERHGGGRARVRHRRRRTSAASRSAICSRCAACRCADNLKPGTLIVSSGLGGTFPRGIPVGTVVAELKTSELWARTYLLRPAVSPADVSDVMVLLPARTTAGVGAVWKIGPHADSAVRSIVAAGDSLARLNARPDTSAAVDSVPKRDSTAARAPKRDSAARAPRATP